MFEALDVFEPGDGVEQLHPHGPVGRPPVQEEQVPPAARVLHRVLDKVHNRVAAELVHAAETEVTCARRFFGKRVDGEVSNEPLFGM